MPRIVSLILAVISIGAGCTPPVAEPSPSPAPAPLMTPAPSPSPAPASSLCDRITPDQVADAVAQPAPLVPEASTEVACTYRVGDPESGAGYDVVIRLEDTFDDLDTIRDIFSDGQDLTVSGSEAYWVPMLPALWVQIDGELHAVQLIQFDEDDGDALALSTALAELLVAAAE